MAKTKDFAVVDLFCGIGGLTHGFTAERFTVSAGVDFDSTCRYAYETNNEVRFHHKDITKLTAEELNELFPKGKRKILVGCAPCQPFSIFNHGSNNNVSKQANDTKWKLLYSFSKLIEAIQPEIVSMENVPNLRTFNDGKVLNDFIELLKKNGYYVSCDVYNAQDYGVPQRRKRLILLASKHSRLKLIVPTHINNYITVRQAIGHLPKIENGKYCKDDTLHYARKLTNISIERIKATPEGGGWYDWDKSLLLECHKKKGGQMYRSVYGRMSWNDVAPTITTYCIGLNNGRFGHPEQNRAISLREAALLQSFPSNYDLINPDMSLNMQTLARHIGNAVPVGLGRAIAKSVKKHIWSIR
jgi:DNA (cytosine-5)-methyltransferase 1